MGRLGRPSEMQRPPCSNGAGVRKQECGGRAGRPEDIIAGHWQMDPERTAAGMKSGVSVAIWGGSDKAVREYRRPALNRFHVLTVRLEGFQAERWQDGQLIREHDTRPGSSTVTLAGVSPRSVIHGPWRSLQIYVPSALLTETAAQADLPSPEIDRIERGLTFDPQLQSLAGSVLDEIAQQRPGSRLQLDSLGMMACIHLLRRAGTKASGEAGRSGGLARWQLKRAMECIAERLDESLSLATLAEEVGLSLYHFARAFKQSVGLTPHRYLLQCRLERAKELLADTELSIAEIAARVGYSEATQLSRLFQAELALSPTAYRRMSAIR